MASGSVSLGGLWRWSRGRGGGYAPGGRQRDDGGAVEDKNMSR